MIYKRQLLIEKKNNFCLFEHAINELTEEIDNFILEEILKRSELTKEMVSFISEEFLRKNKYE